jgi:hypothetical protein
MKTSTLGLIICISMGVLVIAILLQRPRSKDKEKAKEGFVAALIEQDWRVSMSIGLAVGIAFVLVILGIYALYSYSARKASAAPVYPSRVMYYNLN